MAVAVLPMAYVAQAAELRRVDTATLVRGNKQAEDVVVELVMSAVQWIDDINRVSATAKPPGFGGEVDRALYGQRPTGPTGGIETKAAELLEVAPDLRQIPADTAMLDALSKQMGVPLNQFGGALFDVHETATFFAIRIDGFGVLGPWSLDPELHYGRLHGVMPESSTAAATVLVWETNEPQPSNVSATYPISIPQLGERALLLTRADGGVSARQAHHGELTMEIGERLKTRKFP